MSICAAHCSWVCRSRSTNRMTSYSSSVSRIGSVFSHPLGQKVSTCGAPQIRRHRGGLGMDTPPFFCFRYMPIINQFFGKVNCFLPLRGLDAAEQLRGPLPIEKYRCTAYVQRYPIQKASITVYFAAATAFSAPRSEWERSRERSAGPPPSEPSGYRTGPASGPGSTR